MFSFLLTFHSLFRWLVLFSLILSIITAYRGWKGGSAFTSAANSIRHWTATTAHLQLLIGVTIYFQSPTVMYSMTVGIHQLTVEQAFFKYIHIILMLLAVVLITIGSAKAKRIATARAKYRTMLIWFIIALLVIIIAIPWPFSFLASRPYFRAL